MLNLAVLPDMSFCMNCNSYFNGFTVSVLFVGEVKGIHDTYLKSP